MLVSNLFINTNESSQKQEQGARFGQVQAGLQLRRGDVAVRIWIEVRVKSVMSWPENVIFPFLILGRRVGDVPRVIRTADCSTATEPRRRP